MEKIKETIKYYIVLLYYNTIYLKYMSVVELLIEDIKNSVDRDHAISLSSRKIYRRISKSYKEKLINEKYKRMLA